MKKPHNQAPALHILSRTDLSGIELPPGDVIRLVKDAYVSHANGGSRCPTKLMMPLLGGAAGEKHLDTLYNDDWLRERHLLNEAARQRQNRLFTAYQEAIRLAAASDARRRA